jgi:tetratricopeptide (TPR) repeat protein
MAERMFSTLEQTEEVDRLRASNLVRLAIAHRSNDRLEDSRRTLLRAMRERRCVDWSLATQVRANFGATFFYTDWDMTRHHWERAVRIAEQHDLPDRYVHSLIDVAVLDLLEDQPEKAGRELEKSLVLSRDYGFENSELRCLLNLGCVALVYGKPGQALNLLREADRLGFRHRIGRRLWRVRANMATAYFLLGEIEKSIDTDHIVLNSMPSLEGETAHLESKRFLAGTRAGLALANVVLRAQNSEPHQTLLQGLPPLAVEAASAVARALSENKQDNLPALRGRHCKQLNDHRFFLITE